MKLLMLMLAFGFLSVQVQVQAQEAQPAPAASTPIDMHDYGGTYEGKDCSLEIKAYEGAPDYFIASLKHPGFFGIGSETALADFVWKETVDANKQVQLFSGDEDSNSLTLQLGEAGQITEINWEAGHYSPFELPHTDHYECKAMTKQQAAPVTPAAQSDGEPTSPTN